MVAIYYCLDEEGRRKATVIFLDPKGMKVALLAGGSSGEREISLSSGAGAKEALLAAGFQVECIDPAVKEDIMRLIEGDFDVAFLCLHGKMGEDGTIQGFLETIGLPYTGSGVYSSAVSMNKAKAKALYASAGLPTPPSVVVKRGAGSDGRAEAGEVGIPCVVKPASEGSALGVFIVEDGRGLDEAVNKALKIDETVLVEKYVKGTEVTVAVIGNESPIALPIIEIVPMNEFYDFESKYAQGGSKHICPAPIGNELTQLVQKYAAEAHRVLECRGMSRTDFIIDEEGNPWILETNTIPGMTGTSLLPDAARAAGIEFPELCAKLIELALE